MKSAVITPSSSLWWKLGAISGASAVLFGGCIRNSRMHACASGSNTCRLKLHHRRLDNV